MASSRSKRNTGPKLNARGHDPDRPVPWEYTDPETNERVHLSYKYERQEEERMKREHRAQHALLWTKSQPSTASDEDAELAGIGNWVILNTEHAANLRLLGHEVITNGRHLVNAELHFNQLRQLEFVQLSRDLDGAHERDIGISQGTYLDLTITSVRAIRLRIANMQRKLQQSKQALETKPGQDLVRRALKILGCGVVVNKATTDKRTNKTITKVTIANCNTKSCGMPECSLRSYYHKRAKYRANLTTALQDAKNNSTQYRLVHVTIATDWALPTDEPRRARNNPILSTTGHKANHCKAWLPDHKSNAVPIDVEIVKSEVLKSVSSNTDRRLLHNNSTTSYRPELLFRYTYGGREYTSDLLRPNIIITGSASAESAAEELKPFPVGARVKAYLDPGIPDKAYLLQEKGAGPAVFMVIGILLPPLAWFVGKYI